jgi:amino acid permease
VLATLVWIMRGHHALNNFADLPSYGLQAGPQGNLFALGLVLLALMGADMPAVMGAEIAGATKSIRHHLFWGAVLTMGGYLAFTVVLLTVQGANTASNTSNTMVLLIATVDSVFGKIGGDIMAWCLLFYFALIPTALNITLSRLFIAAANDRRISLWFARINRQGVPMRALVTQAVMASIFVFVGYFVVPYLLFLPGKPADLNNEVYQVLGASLVLVWSLSFIFLFLDAAFLAFRDRQGLHRARVAPVWVLTCSIIAGIGLCATIIVTTLAFSFIPTLIPNSSWWEWVGGAAIVEIAFCSMLTMYTNSKATYEVLQESTQFIQ